MQKTAPAEGQTTDSTFCKTTASLKNQQNVVPEILFEFLSKLQIEILDNNPPEEQVNPNN